MLQEFLSQHLWPWAPAWLAQVETAAQYQLYRSAAKLGAALLAEVQASAEP